MIVTVDCDRPSIISIECDNPVVFVGNYPAPKRIVIEMTKDGVDGKSAYQIAVENGYTGTETEFGNMLLSIEEKEDKINWFSLVRGSTARELLSNDSLGKKYAYSYGTNVLYRFIRADKTDDSFFLEIELTNKIASKKVEINL